MKISLASLGEEPNARFLEQVKLAELLGFYAFGHSDEKWTRDMWVRLSAAAAVTSRIGLCSTVTDPYTRHPALTAQKAATLAELAGPGRFRLMTGAGSHFETLPGYGNPRPVRGLRESIALTRQLWTGARVTMDGDIVKFQAGRLDFDPQVTPQIYIASRGPQILKLAGEIADGVLIGSFATPAGITYARDEIGKGLQTAGRTWADIRLASWLYIAILDDADEPIPENIKRGMSHALWSSRNFLRRKIDELTDDITEDFRTFYDEAPHVWSPEVMAALRQRLPRGLFDTMAVVGTEQQVIARLQALAACGIEEAILWPFPRPDEEVEDLIVRIARSILPHVAERPARQAYRLVD